MFPGKALIFFDLTINLRFAAEGDEKDRPAGSLRAGLVIVAKLVAIINTFQFCRMGVMWQPLQCFCIQRYGTRRRAESAKTVIAVGVVAESL
jgi:hypothetical protein